MESNWYDDRAKLAAFLDFLAEDPAWTKHDLVRVVKKPQGWTREYEDWKATAEMLAVAARETD